MGDQFGSDSDLEGQDQNQTVQCNAGTFTIIVTALRFALVFLDNQDSIGVVESPEAWLRSVATLDRMICNVKSDFLIYMSFSTLSMVTSFSFQRPSRCPSHCVRVLFHPRCSMARTSSQNANGPTQSSFPPDARYPKSLNLTAGFSELIFAPRSSPIASISLNEAGRTIAGTPATCGYASKIARVARTGTRFSNAVWIVEEP